MGRAAGGKMVVPGEMKLLLQQLRQMVETCGLNKVCADKIEARRYPMIMCVVGARKHDNWKTNKLAVRVEPVEEFESTGTRHAKIKQEKGWNRVRFAVGVVVPACDVIGGLVAIGHEPQGDGVSVCPGKSPAQEEDIIWIVFGD